METTLSITECVIVGLEQGKEYDFRVCAVNFTGQGPYAVTGKSVVIEDPACTPLVPSRLRVINVSEDGVLLKWTAPELYGCYPVTSYVIEKLTDCNEAEWRR